MTFSATAIVQTRLIGRDISTAPRNTDSMLHAPTMYKRLCHVYLYYYQAVLPLSQYIVSIPEVVLILSPPASKTIPLPTRATTGASFLLLFPKIIHHY